MFVLWYTQFLTMYYNKVAHSSKEKKMLMLKNPNVLHILLLTREDGYVPKASEVVEFQIGKYEIFGFNV